MSVNLGPNLFDKIQPYLKALVECVASSEPTYNNIKGKDCQGLVDAYLNPKNYIESTGFTKTVQIAPQLLSAYMAVLRRLKFVDPARINYEFRGIDLRTALYEIVYGDFRETQAVPSTKGVTEAQQTGGGDDLTKIIKLSKSEVSGFVPYPVNNIAGSYTDDYLSSLNSKIRRLDSQFGGFKKVAKEVIGSIEDLDRILRADLENQIDASVFKRYYKTYPIMSQKGGSKYIKEIWDWYNAPATTAEEREVFDAYAEFVLEFADTAVGSTDKIGSRLRTPLKKGDKIDGGYLRVNLKKSRGEIISYASRYSPSGSIKKGSATPLILLILPENDEIYKIVFDYWYSEKVDSADDLGDLLKSLGVSGATNKIDDDAKKLGEVFSCNESTLKSLLKSDLTVDDDEPDMFNSKFDKEFGVGKKFLRNGYRWNRATSAIQKKNTQTGEWEAIIEPSKAEYRKIFNKSEKCFNSFAELKDEDECCRFIPLLFNGETKKFFDAVKNLEFTVKDLDTDFRNINPITVVKLLEGYKFEKMSSFDEVYGTVKKFTNYDTWLKNVIEPTSELTQTEKDNIKSQTVLKDVLDMSVAFVNNNLNLLNPHIDPMASSTNRDKKLELNKVFPVENSPQGHPLQGRWWREVTAKARKNMLPSITLPVFPLNGAQMFYTGYMHGGDIKTEVTLQETEIIPQYTTRVYEDLKSLIDHLKTNNKVLSGSEMEKLNKELQAFQEAEIELTKKLILINKYIKVARLMNDNDSQVLSENKIRRLISQYYEDYAAFSDKDFELKGINSYIRSVLKEPL